MNLVDVLNGIWNQILEITSLFVMPDWGGVIALLPVLIVLGVVAPFLTFLALGTVIYLVRKPRVKVAYEEGPRVAEIGADGEPVFPVGLPYCRRDALIYPSGTLRCETCHDPLAVDLPDVRPRPRRPDRHLHQLRARPEGQEPVRRAARGRRPQARRRGRRLSR